MVVNAVVSGTVEKLRETCHYSVCGDPQSEVNQTRTNLDVFGSLKDCYFGCEVAGDNMKGLDSTVVGKDRLVVPMEQSSGGNNMLVVLHLMEVEEQAESHWHCGE
jgi:hypothetical protein